MISDSTDNQINPNTQSRIETVSLSHIENRDPIGDGVRRTAQQHVIPAAIGKRALNFTITNNPEVGGEPKWAIFLIPSGSNFWVIWSTESTLDGTNPANELIGIPLTSVFVQTSASAHLTDFDDATHYPNSTYHMGNFPVSTWVDENDQNNINLRTIQTMYNNSGADVYAACTIRMRLLLSGANTASTSLLNSSSAPINNN